MKDEKKTDADRFFKKAVAFFEETKGWVATDKIEMPSDGRDFYARHVQGTPQFFIGRIDGKPVSVMITREVSGNKSVLESKIYVDTTTPYEKLSGPKHRKIKPSSRLSSEKFDEDAKCFEIQTMKKGLLPITAQKLSGTSFREFNPTDRKGTVLYKPPAENTSAAIRSFLNLALKIAEVKSKKVQQNTQESPNLSTESVPDGGRVARPLNLILCGPPGTGKTYDTPSRAVEIIDGHARDHSEAYPRFQELCRKGRIAFITFHQSYSYEDFVEGIRPVIDRRKAKGTVRYECRAGIFKQMAIRAFSDCLERTEQSRGAKSTAGVSKSKDADKVQGFLRKGADSGWQMRASESCPPYVLIIDEINRGNISKIFGELITLMEDDKRAGQPVALTVTLPYSGDLFSIPPNLYILGTMNTADKSIALVDVALRRRFEFEQLAPDFLVCAEITPDMRKVLENLNERIVLRKDWDHRIGHAYFRGVADEDRFNEVFERKIIPLLQEYFHNDWDSLRFVLGETGEKEEFIHKLPDSDARSARTKWRWYFDGEESRDFDCLEKLRGNYSI